MDWVIKRGLHRGNLLKQIVLSYQSYCSVFLVLYSLHGFQFCCCAREIFIKTQALHQHLHQTQRLVLPQLCLPLFLALLIWSTTCHFVHYNVQSIFSKLDILHTELFDFDILAFTETWLTPAIETDDVLLRSYNAPERKDRVEDNHGGVMLYVKDGIHYKRRGDLEIRAIESIWIEIANNHKRILFGLFYRPPNSNANYYSNIEDSLSLAVDTGINDIIVTGDFNLNLLNPLTSKKN